MLNPSEVHRPVQVCLPQKVCMITAYEVQLYLQCTCAVNRDLAYICSSSFRDLSDVCNARWPCTAACLGHDTGKTNVSFNANRILGSILSLFLQGKSPQALQTLCVFHMRQA